MTEGRLDDFRDTLKEIVNIKNGILPEDAEAEDFLELTEPSVMQ